MPSARQYNKSKYMKKEDCSPDILVTIKGFRAEDMAWTGEPEDMRWVLEFEEDVKDFVIGNIINQDTIIDMAGTDDLSKWIGLKIVLYVNPDIEHKGKRVGGIRIREPKNQQPPPTQPSGPNPEYVGDNPAPPDDNIPF